MIDNRGTGGRGTAFRHTVYKRLGEMEVNDMIEGAKYLSTLKYVDASRLGIGEELWRLYGCSYNYKSSRLF
jgi:dipeptidyl-peptidase 4